MVDCIMHSVLELYKVPLSNIFLITSRHRLKKMKQSIYKEIVIEQNTQHPNHVIVRPVRAAAVTEDLKLNQFTFYRLDLIELSFSLIE